MQREKFNCIFKSVSDFFGVMANADRLKILGFLQKGELDVQRIHEMLDISQSRVSQNLKLLKDHSFVKERREGKHVYYSLKDARISKIVEAAIQLQASDLNSEKQIADLLNELVSLWNK
jgi:DNA-binding transcriptional ArsR family regulator